MKSIVVPKNKNAEIELDYNRADETTLITWNLSNSEYKELEHIGVFNKINNLCEVLIDEYEDEHIPAEKLVIISEIFSKSSNDLVKELSKLINEAIERNTSIHFYF